MFKPLVPSHAATCDRKAPAAVCTPGSGQPSLLRAEFSAELRKLLSQLVVLR